MLRQEETEIHITTSCEDLDAILGGGVKRKEITEVGQLLSSHLFL